MSMLMEKPRTEEEVAAIVREAHGRRQTIEILGGGSKRGIGRPVDAAVEITTAGLSGIVAYEPTEMVITARAGTPLATIQSELNRNNQMLAFEPPDWRELLGTAKTEPTIGAVAATNLSGPRRFAVGAARDCLLGIRFVNGEGEIVRNGGRVMKNVTGLDLVKLMAGSWGTLGLMTEVVFKVLPKRETETTLLVHGLDDEDATAALAAAMATPAEVSGAAHLPDLVSGLVLDGRLKGGSVTALRLEGFPESVKARIAMLEKVLGKGRDLSLIEEQTSKALWADIGNVKPFCDGTTRCVWKVSVAPTAGWRVVDAFRRSAAATAFYDWQGGLVWLRTEADAEAEALRAAIARFGAGHATLIRADAETRRTVPVFQPQAKAVDLLQARVRAAFDPQRLFNPGRMGA